MKSDSERQAAYQQRRLKKETRIVLWLGKDTERLISHLRGGQTRSDWVRHAIQEQIYRQLAGVAAGEALTEEQLTQARKRAAELGFKA